MYGYSNYVPLNKQEVLKRAGQDEIFEIALGYKPKEYQYVTSPFREDDTHPGAYFEFYQGKLHFIDWADPMRSHYDCFNAIEKVCKTKNFHQTLTLINKRLKLGLGTSYHSLKGESHKAPDSVKKERPPKTPRDIEFKTRMFNSVKDGNFWGKYNISRENLLEDNVFPIIWFKVYSKKLNKKVVIRPSTPAYAINVNGRIKIYTPDAKGIGKWVTNCTENDIGSADALPDFGDKLVITKSYKDCRVLRNLGICSVWIQNEGMIPSADVLLPLISRFNEVFVLFDNDSTGLLAGDKIVSFINGYFKDKSRKVYLPIELLRDNIKDPSDLVDKKDEEDLVEFLMKNEILC